MRKLFLILTLAFIASVGFSQDKGGGVLHFSGAPDITVSIDGTEVAIDRESGIIYLYDFVTGTWYNTADTTSRIAMEIFRDFNVNGEKQPTDTVVAGSGTVDIFTDNADSGDGFAMSGTLTGSTDYLKTNLLGNTSLQLDDVGEINTIGDTTIITTGNAVISGTSVFTDTIADYPINAVIFSVGIAVGDLNDTTYTLLDTLEDDNLILSAFYEISNDGDLDAEPVVTFFYQNDSASAPSLEAEFKADVSTEIVLVRGDTNGDNVLNPGEVWLYRTRRTYDVQSGNDVYIRFKNISSMAGGSFTDTSIFAQPTKGSG